MAQIYIFNGMILLMSASQLIEIARFKKKLHTFGILLKVYNNT